MRSFDSKNPRTARRENWLCEADGLTSDFKTLRQVYQDIRVLVVARAAHYLASQ
jgi:hypothetical protein